MSGLTKVGLALILVFVFFLMALAAELLYILWYRRRFPRAPPGADNPELAAAIEPRVSPNSKELLLYLLCWKNQSRIEPTSTAVTPMYSVAAVTPGFPHPAVSTASSTKSPAAAPPPPSSSATVDAEMAKWRGFYASRVLFTIREEEKEGPDSDGGSALHVVDEKGVDEQAEEESVSNVQVGEEEEADNGVVVVDDPAFHFTPFSTPCASPPFYTPTPSPPRGLDAGADAATPLDADASDDEVFSPAEEELPAAANPPDGDGEREVSGPPVICTASAGAGQ